MISILRWFRRLLMGTERRSRETVLVFSQESMVPFLLEAALRPAGFDVHLATNVEEGIVTHWQHHERVALVVLDRPMLGLSHHQLLTRLRVADPMTPCCVLTPHGEALGQNLATLGAMPLARPTNLAETCKAVLPFARQGRGREDSVR